NNDLNSVNTFSAKLSTTSPLIEPSLHHTNLKSLEKIPDKYHLITPPVSSGSLSPKVVESLSMQPLGSDVLTNNVKSSIKLPPLDNNSNIFSNNNESDEPLYITIRPNNSRSRSYSDLTLNDKKEIISPIIIPKEIISPIIIPKETPPSSEISSPLTIISQSSTPINLSSENQKSKLSRIPTGRRPIKFQSPTQEIPDTPILLSDDSIFFNKEKKFNLQPIQRIRKDSKASESMSDDAKDINIKSNYSRSTRIKDNDDDDKPLQTQTYIPDDKQSRTKNIDNEERGRTKSRVNEIDERGRAKSKVREIDERERAKSRVREIDERERA
ncbi:7611_t:CDS:2, partial [Scutellospora calospora]